MKIIKYIPHEHEVIFEVTMPWSEANEEIAKEVINGKWGNGAARKQNLEAAGYNYSTIQSIVNNLLK